MEIKIDTHTSKRAEERGASEDEIKDVINTGIPILAKYGHSGKYKVYNFKQKRLAKYYEQKKIEVFYTVEQGKIITITVYVFYGKWEV